jgi:FkbM family methyltransferase
MKSTVTTIVLDVGARYGMHPSWDEFQGEMLYLAFEPDPEEAERLRKHVRRPGFEVVEEALDRQDGVRDLFLPKHRGLSSFLKPDLQSECFRHLKPGQAEIEKIIPVPTTSIDALSKKRGIAPDFIKVDTEGTEQDVIEGAAGVIGTSVLGVRASCNFQACYVGQRLFSEQHDFLLQRDFVLLNLDYKGFGYPRLGLFRKPDPIEAENHRYGMLVAADAVWIRKMDWLVSTYGPAGEAALQTALCKLAYFCMLNNAPDVGIDLLHDHFGPSKASFHPEVSASRLFKGLRLQIAEFLGRWRTVPDEQWLKCMAIYRRIFGEDLGGGSGFYPQIQAMKAELMA